MDFQGEIKMNKLQALLIAGLLSLSSVSFASTVDYAGGLTANSSGLIEVSNNTSDLNVAGQFSDTKELFYDIRMADGFDGLLTTFGSSTLANNDPFAAFADVFLYEAGILVAGGVNMNSFTYLLATGTTYLVQLVESDLLSSSSSSLTVSSVPVPAAGILFASVLLGAGAFGRRKKKAQASVVGAFARAS